MATLGIILASPHLQTSMLALVTAPTPLTRVPFVPRQALGCRFHAPTALPLFAHVTACAVMHPQHPHELQSLPSALETYLNARARRIHRPHVYLGRFRTHRIPAFPHTSTVLPTLVHTLTLTAQDLDPSLARE